MAGGSFSGELARHTTVWLEGLVTLLRSSPDSVPDVKFKEEAFSLAVTFYVKRKIQNPSAFTNN